MPVVKIYGVTATVTEEELQDFCKDLARVITKVEPLGLTEEMITFFFPQDMMVFGLGEEIIIFADGLFVKPERTNEVRKELARQIGFTTRMRFPGARTECFVRPFDPDQGFWSSGE